MIYLIRVVGDGQLGPVPDDLKPFTYMIESALMGMSINLIIGHVYALHISFMPGEDMLIRLLQDVCLDVVHL